MNVDCGAIAIGCCCCTFLLDTTSDDDDGSDSCVVAVQVIDHQLCCWFHCRVALRLIALDIHIIIIVVHCHSIKLLLIKGNDMVPGVLSNCHCCCFVVVHVVFCSVLVSVKVQVQDTKLLMKCSCICHRAWV